MRDYTSPGRSAPDTENPYRTYVAYAPATQDTRRHGAMLFHDGNAGHFWRGELASQAGEIFFTVGLILWITYLTYSPVAMAIIVAMQALPWVICGPLGASLQSAADPERMLRRVGFVRVVCALGVVALQLLHYRGILFGVEYPSSTRWSLWRLSRGACARICAWPRRRRVSRPAS